MFRASLVNVRTNRMARSKGTIMKRLTVIGVLAIFITTSAFACGPMTSGGGGQTTSGGGGDTTKRQQWTKKRMQELKRRRQQDKGRGGFSNSDIRSGPFGLTENPYLNNNEAELRRRDAIRRQRMVDAIEFLALKKERGELSPEGQRKLNELLRRVRTEGH
jgi:hypothetical protein